MAELVYDVCVVGLGPSGLALSLLLSELGIRVVAVERNEQVPREPRAASIDDWALSILDRICDGLEFSALKTQIVGGSSGEKLLFEIPANGDVSFFFQPDLETRLRKELAKKKNVTTMYGSMVNDVIEQKTQCDVMLLGKQRLSASFVVGCDGASSVVRKAAGLRLEGTSFPNSRWYVADCVLKEHPLKTFRFIADHRRPGLDLPLPSNHCRFEFTLAENESVPSREQLIKWIEARGVKKGQDIEFTRCAEYVFHARQCMPDWISFGKRIIVCGDACHLMPPMRGQGMCSGIHDVSNVFWKIGLIVQGYAPLTLLDTYQEEREARVVCNTKVAVWLEQLICSRSYFFATLRNFFMPIITLRLLSFVFKRDTFIAPQNLWKRMSSLKGGDVDAGKLMKDLKYGSSFALFLRRKTDLDMSPECAKFWKSIKGEILVDPKLPYAALLMRPDRHVHSSFRSHVPKDILEQLTTELAYDPPKMVGEWRKTIHMQIFDTLRIATPPFIIYTMFYSLLMVAFFMYIKYF